MLGEEKLQELQNAHVLVAGLGGVGAYAAEMIVRAGVGQITIVDSDVVSVSNINRQLLALNSTVGKTKVEVMKNRLLDINPNVKINILETYIDMNEVDRVLDFARYDCVVDAIDTLVPKVLFIEGALNRGYELVSSMGAGAKIDPTQIQICDISNTHHCRLAHMLRKRLGKNYIAEGFWAVFSVEPTRKEAMMECDELNKRSVVGTISYMPAVFGCVAASAAIRIIIGEPIMNELSQ